MESVLKNLKNFYFYDKILTFFIRYLFILRFSYSRKNVNIKNMKKIIFLFCPVIILLTKSIGSYSQSVVFKNTPSISQSSNVTISELAGEEVNSITTAVSFLTIAPDSRSGAMGDAGVATSPDASSQHWNPAKYAFVEKDMGLSISYSPWLRNLIGDIDLSYLSFYKKIGKNNTQAIGASLLYFSLGNITFTDIGGYEIRDFNPNEFAIDASYSFLLSEHLSGGIALRYIYSNLTGGVEVDGSESFPGWTIAADWSMYYQKDIDLFDRDCKMAFGYNFSNIGGKISYTDDATENFIPINARIGGALTIDLDEYNTMTFTTDLNKLMVPTSPYYEDGGTTEDDIIAGKWPYVPVAQGIIQSFYDAPGVLLDDDTTRSVWREELREITYSFGMEYWYSKQFALRAGYFHEHATKGNRKFFTVGLGLKLNVFGLDFSYLVPTAGRNHPLANTMRFSLYFDFEGFKQQKLIENE